MPIRVAKDSDFDTLLGIQKDAITSLYDYYSHDEINSWIDFINDESAKRYAKFKNAIYEHDGTPIGFICWQDGDSESTIVNLFVLPSYQNHGVGKALLEYAEEKLEHHEVKIRATLNAVNFYETLGYEVIGDDKARAGFAIKIMHKL